MAEIENIHCPICTQPIPSSWQNGLPPALATDERRGVWCVNLILHSKNGIRKFWHSQIESKTGWHFQMEYSLFVFLAFSDGILLSSGILKWKPTLLSINVLEFSILRWNPLYFGILRWNPLSHF